MQKHWHRKQREKSGPKELLTKLRARPCVYVEPDDRKMARKVFDLVYKNKSTALDTEFPTEGSRKHEAIIWSLSGAHGQRFVLHGEWLRNKDSPFLPWLADKKTRITYFNFNADADVVEANAGIDIEKSFYTDTYVLGWLRNNSKFSYNLKDEGTDYLKWDRTGQGYAELFSYVPQGKKKRVTVSPDVLFDGPLPAEMLAVMTHAEWIELFKLYSADDAEVTHALHRNHKAVLMKWGYWPTYLAINAPYTITLRHFQKRGIPIDMAALEDLNRRVTVNLLREQTCIRAMAGRPDLNLSTSAKDLRKLVFDEWEWPTYEDLMTKGGKDRSNPQPQLNKRAWLRYATDEGFKFAERMLEYNKYSKRKGTFVDGISLGVKHGPGADINRLFSSYNQCGTKCMPPGELVLTSRGYLPVEDVRVGDFVITHTGRTAKVTECVNNGVKRVYTVTLSNGLQLRTTGNHPYRTPSAWKNARDLQPGDCVQVHSAPEEWRTIEAWDQFEVSSWGRVRNKRTGTVLAQQRKNRWGHLKVLLHRDGAQQRGPDRKDKAVHRLVAEAFHVSLDANQTEVRHLNGIAFDNTTENLAFGTSLDNKADARKHGTTSKRAVSSKLTEANVAALRSLTRAQVSDAAAAMLLSVSRELVRDVRLGKRWLPQDDTREPRAVFRNAVVKSVTRGDREQTHGLTVERDHSHVTGGIVTHNTGRMSSRKFKVKITYNVEKTYKTRPNRIVQVTKTVKAGMNMLNFPNAFNDEDGVRAVVVPPPPDEHAPEGYDLVVADFSGFELYTTLWSVTKRGIKSRMLKELKSGVDVHSLTAKHVCELDCDWQDVKKLYPDKRNAEGKRCNFNLLYGGGARMLCRIMGWDERDDRNVRKAQRMIDIWQDLYPEMPKYQRIIVAEAYDQGYVTTIAGRRLQLKAGLLSSDEGIVRHYENMAKNGPSQGSAADIVQDAQNRIEQDKELSRKFGYQQAFNVYDEIVGWARKKYSQEALKRVIWHMQQPFADQAPVPWPVEGKVAANWRAAK